MPSSGDDYWPSHDFRVKDRVALADGRCGTIVGFYRERPEKALVELDAGGKLTLPVDTLRDIDGG